MTIVIVCHIYIYTSILHDIDVCSMISTGLPLGNTTHFISIITISTVSTVNSKVIVNLIIHIMTVIIFQDFKRHFSRFAKQGQTINVIF